MILQRIKAMVRLVNWTELFENKNRLFWIAHTAGWFSFAIVHYLGSLQHDLRGIFLVIIFLNAYAGWLLTIPLRYVYQKAWNITPIKIVLLVILSSYFTGVLWQIIKNINYWEIYKHGYEPEFWFMYMQSSLGSFYIILSWSGLYFGSKYYQMLQVEKQNVLKANSVAHQAQLKMLRYQLNPHFLFNTLNAISTLILVKENSSANSMVSKLSEFLRYSLDKDPMKKVNLDTEIHALKLYLAIEKVRFENRLTLDFQINDDCKHALVPSMILQPLAENAIKHAIAVQEEGGTITITVKRLANDLLIEIADNGPGAEINNGHLYRECGIGLVNTRERLQAMYYDKFSLVVSHNHPSGVKVNISIPYNLS